MADDALPTALVVEDEPRIRAGVVKEFINRGWRVIETSFAENVVDVYGVSHFDVLVTDIHLAGRLTGWDVAEAIRNFNEAIPLIYTSSFAPNRSRQVERSLFLEKPCLPSDIVDACERMLTTEQGVST